MVLFQSLNREQPLCNLMPTSRSCHCRACFNRSTANSPSATWSLVNLAVPEFGFNRSTANSPSATWLEFLSFMSYDIVSIAQPRTAPLQHLLAFLLSHSAH